LPFPTHYRQRHIHGKEKSLPFCKNLNAYTPYRPEKTLWLKFVKLDNEAALRNTLLLPRQCITARLNFMPYRFG
jgi:hypothetical protein